MVQIRCLQLVGTEWNGLEWNGLQQNGMLGQHFTWNDLERNGMGSYKMECWEQNVKWTRMEWFGTRPSAR